MKRRTTFRNHAAWIGPLVSIAGFVSYFTVMVRQPDLRDSAAVNLAVVGLGAAIAGWGVVRRRNWKSWAGLVAAVVPAALFAYHIFVYSSQLPASFTAPAVGTRAPALELPDQSGRVVSLADRAGRRVLVVFYRGFW